MSKFFESLLEMDSTVIALDVDNLESSLLHLRALSRSTGKSFYYWSENNGLHSMKDSEITVPGCNKLIDAFRHISNSLHFGIYIFSGFESQLTYTTIEALRKISTNTVQSKHCIILIAENLKLPGVLESALQKVTYHEEARARLKLRDGRWLVT